MTTSTDKSVTRVTTGSYSGRIIGPRPRRIAITILPGDTLMLRLFGTQQREYMSIADAFSKARSARALAEMSTRRAANKRRAK
jgi:hypothetical protein